ncbi:MAG: DUF4349 domain-containing protein [Micrococcales bacterium]|nr:DUF4349 domain-containing protein [Micrococcales bacterium]
MPTHTTIAGASPRSRRAAAALVAALALGTTACSAGGGASSEAASSQSRSVAAQDNSAGDSLASAKRDAGSTVLPPGTQPRTPVTGDQIARTAELSLKVDDLDAAAAKVREIGTRSGGLLVSENLGEYRDGDGPTYGGVSVSVPADRLDATLAELGRLGTVLSRQTESENVSAETIDTEARLATMKASVARVRALMDRATGLDQVVELEKQLSDRQAQLESLQSQLAGLKGRVAMSTITVSLSTDGRMTGDSPGFLGGLRAGWAAFTASMGALVTLLGAVLPFAAFGVLVAAPVVWLWRRSRRGRAVLAPAARPAAARPAASGPAAGTRDDGVADQTDDEVDLGRGHPEVRREAQ